MKRKLLALTAVLFFLAAASPADPPHSATLNWSWSGGAITGFHVLRSQASGGPFIPIATIGPTASSFTDNTLVAGQTYYYVVTAFNSLGDSPPSNQAACAVPLKYQPRAQPCSTQ
jgi:hypothetical protein